MVEQRFHELRIGDYFCMNNWEYIIDNTYTQKKNSSCLLHVPVLGSDNCLECKEKMFLDGQVLIVVTGHLQK